VHKNRKRDIETQVNSFAKIKELVAQGAIDIPVTQVHLPGGRVSPAVIALDGYGKFEVLLQSAELFTGTHSTPLVDKMRPVRLSHSQSVGTAQLYTSDGNEPLLVFDLRNLDSTDVLGRVKKQVELRLRIAVSNGLTVKLAHEGHSLRAVGPVEIAPRTPHTNSRPPQNKWARWINRKKHE
jgi:hypothetical protein